jgi:hypothetical protein
MKDLLLGYEESIKFKKLGFDDACFAYFDEQNDLEPYKKFSTQFDNMVNSNLPSINDSFLDGVSKPFECCTAPTYDQALNFIWDKHKSHGEFFCDYQGKIFGYKSTTIINAYFSSKGSIVKGFEKELDAKKHFIKNFLNNFK